MNFRKKIEGGLVEDESYILDELQQDHDSLDEVQKQQKMKKMMTLIQPKHADAATIPPIPGLGKKLSLPPSARESHESLKKEDNYEDLEKVIIDGRQKDTMAALGRMEKEGLNEVFPEDATPRPAAKFTMKK